ncbi:MAG: hypothetical protein R6U27_08525 [Desulfobacterales bacterium]
MEENKKMVAAVSAVLNYLKEEEDIMGICMQAAAQYQPEAMPAPVPHIAFSRWALSGRTEQMQLRNMMQMKAFYR